MFVKEDSKIQTLLNRKIKWSFENRSLPTFQSQTCPCVFLRPSGVRTHTCEPDVVVRYLLLCSLLCVRVSV